MRTILIGDRMIRYIVAVIGSLFLFTPGGWAQEETPTHSLKAKALSEGNRILLRWAPANTKAWVEIKRYGVRIEKYTVMDQQGLVDNPLPEYPAGTALRPAPVEQWEKLALASNYAAVIAQAFYGEDFELTTINTSDIGTVINQAQELEQRYATSVFMAEYDFEAAKLAAWAWEDRQANAGEKYLYRIIMNKNKPEAGDTTAVFIGTDEVHPLPEPLTPAALFGDKSVMLSWNYQLLSAQYHSYHIERSLGDQQSFVRLSDLPLTPFSAQMPEIIYSDSLPDNETTCYYRICGINSFGQQGPFSKVVSGCGKKLETCLPVITYGYFSLPDIATIGWELDCMNPEQIDSLNILRAAHPEGPYLTVVNNVLVERKEHSFSLTDETNYIQLCLYLRTGEKHVSYPYMIRQTDSIPPAVPENLKVEIDSAGVAHLSWTPNTEKDLRGYRVLRSFSEKEEKSPVSPQFLTEPYFTDSLSMSTINRKVYYQLTAVDMRYNESLPCPAVLALKPDNLPLIPPELKHYEVKEGCISLSWSTDRKGAATYYIFRKAAGDTIPEELIAYSGAATTSYCDCPPASGRYEYFVVAVNRDKRYAFSPQTLTVYIEVKAPALRVSDFNAFRAADHSYVELSWKTHPKAKAYRLYKNELGKPMQLWKELDALTTKVVDEYITPATDYVYTIVLVPSKLERCAPKSITVKY